MKSFYNYAKNISVKPSFSRRTATIHQNRIINESHHNIDLGRGWRRIIWRWSSPFFHSCWRRTSKVRRIKHVQEEEGRWGSW